MQWRLFPLSADRPGIVSDGRKDFQGHAGSLSFSITIAEQSFSLRHILLQGLVSQRKVKDI
jgi:hypothetical protein